jgi:osmotically-inducible protein OsmY
MKNYYAALLTTAVIACTAIAAGATSPSDARIVAAVKKTHVYRHDLKNDHIKVSAKDGVVMLTGSVSEGYHKTLASEAAFAQEGVASVDDRLEIKPGGPSAGSDEWLVAKIKTALLFHRSVSASKTKVDAKGGAVTLTGTVASQAQKDLTTEYVRDVEGVKDVRNDLTVASSPSEERRLEEKMDDASITSEVKVTLLFHRSTSALNTGVKTMNGVVTLSGKASSTAEKDLAEKIASDVKGVKNVNNQIKVN